MRKKIVSLILAVLLVFGACFASVSEAEAAGKAKYTKLTLGNVTTVVTFNVVEAQRALAADNLSKVLNTTLKKGKSFAITVNGKVFTAKKQGKPGKGNVYVGSQTLKDFILANKGKSTSVKVSVNIKKAVSFMKLTKKKSAYGYRVDIGGANVTNLKINKKNKITFKGNGKKMTAYVKGGAVYIKGNAKNTAFVKELKKAAVVKKITVTKVKTSSLAK